MPRRLRPAITAAACSLAALVPALTALPGAPAAAQDAPPAPQAALSLWAPERTTAWSYGGRAFTDLGLRLVADGAPFELRSTRTSYTEPVRTVWRSPAGDVRLPTAATAPLGSLKRFVTITARPVRGGAARSFTRALCLGGASERVRPDAPATSPYPRTCGYNPYALGAVQGIQDGWATSVLGYESPLRLGAGRYDVVARIDRRYAEALGLPASAATVRTRLVVREEEMVEEPVPGPRPHRVAPQPAPRPAGAEPAAPAAGAVEGPVPDLRSLPAWGIGVSPNGNFLQFSATVWNAGDSPLVVDGFRRQGEDEMDGYQYFFDADGVQTGYRRVGHFHWDAKPTHQHWHFKDFAAYTLLRADRTEVVKSRKEAFCLANTDAVDLTVPGADWDVENSDLATACGDYSSLSIREVLAAGWGDTYAQFRAGQSFDLRGLPNGTYYVAVTANPRGRLVEASTANNQALRKVVIGGRPGARTVRVPRVGLVVEPRFWGR